MKIIQNDPYYGHLCLLLAFVIFVIIAVVNVTITRFFNFFEHSFFFQEFSISASPQF